MRGIQKTQQEFIDEVSEKHNNFYTYTKTDYVRSIDKIIVTCPSHGDFHVLANNHVRGKGCKLCAIKNNSLKRILGNEVFLARAFAKHGDRYSYPECEVSTLKCTVTVICPSHGEFITTPYGHLHGVGCPECAKDLRSTSQVHSLDMFLEKARTVHGQTYDYSLITTYDGAKSKVRIICKEHGEFSQFAANHYSGADCPVCKPGGYNNKLSGSFYVLLDKNILKVGITNKFVQTRADYINTKSKLQFGVVVKMYSKDGILPQQVERVALQWLRENYSSIDAEFNGSTECFLDVDLDDLMKLVVPLI